MDFLEVELHHVHLNRTHDLMRAPIEVDYDHERAKPHARVAHRIRDLPTTSSKFVSEQKTVVLGVAIQRMKVIAMPNTLGPKS